MTILLADVYLDMVVGDFLDMIYKSEPLFSTDSYVRLQAYDMLDTKKGVVGGCYIG